MQAEAGIWKRRSESFSRKDAQDPLCESPRQQDLEEKTEQRPADGKGCGQKMQNRFVCFGKQAAEGLNLRK